MDHIQDIDLEIAKKLREDEEYRRAFFRADVADSIATQIRDLRQRLDLKQAELAACAGMKQSAVSRIEQAEYSSWSFNTLTRVAEALKARLIVTLQPTEQAITEYEMNETATVTRAKSGSYIAARELSAAYTAASPAATEGQVSLRANATNTAAAVALIAGRIPGTQWSPANYTAEVRAYGH